MSQIDLSGQVAIISGALGDLGSAIALAFADAGADIALGDIADADVGAGLRQKIEALGQRACYHQVDVSDSAAVTQWLADVEQELGLATLIIANAGIYTSVSPEELPFDQWQQVLNINLNGAYFLSKIASRRLVDNNKTGRVVFMGSCAASIPQAPSTLYCVSKAGVRMLSQCLALELAPHNILVNEVAPGNVLAGMAKKEFEKHPGMEQRAAAVSPMNQNIDIADVVYQFLYLCDPRNKKITGSRVEVDSGIRLAFPDAAKAEE